MLEYVVAVQKPEQTMSKNWFLAPKYHAGTVYNETSNIAHNIWYNTWNPFGDQPLKCKGYKEIVAKPLRHGGMHKCAVVIKSYYMIYS